MQGMLDKWMPKPNSVILVWQASEGPQRGAGRKSLERVLKRATIDAKGQRAGVVIEDDVDDRTHRHPFESRRPAIGVDQHVLQMAVGITIWRRR